MSILWGARIDGDVYGGRGDAPWDAGTWDTFESHAGKKVSIVHWGQPFGALDTNALNLAKGRGAVSLISVDFPVASIVSGSQDAVIDALAQKAKTWGGEILLRPGWEMNGTWYAWGRQSDYVKAWVRYVSRIRAIAPNVKFVWCVNAIWDGPSDPAPWFPGSAYVDWVGMDGYNKDTPWKSPFEVFKQTYDRLGVIAPGKPIMICETGCREAGGSKAAWITNLLSTALPKRFPAVKALVWFNWNIVEGGERMDWQIESSGSAQAAFKKGIAAGYYQAG